MPVAHRLDGAGLGVTVLVPAGLLCRKAGNDGCQHQRDRRCTESDECSGHACLSYALDIEPSDDEDTRCLVADIAASMCRRHITNRDPGRL